MINPKLTAIEPIDHAHLENDALYISYLQNGKRFRF